jgi:hypothetical protein
MFPRALRLALAALWVCGAALASITAALSARHHTGQAGAYAAIAAALIAMAVLTARGQPVVTIVGLVICAVQPLAVIATAWELVHGISASQVDKLEALGVDPTLGVTVNLIFSAVASVLAMWAYLARRGRSG